MFGIFKKAYKAMDKQSEVIVENNTMGLAEDVNFNVTYEYGNWNESGYVPIKNSTNPLEHLKFLTDAYMARMTGVAEGGFVSYESTCGRYMGAWVR